MPELIVLHLSGNKIKIIPRDINNMKSLEVLSLDNNQVEVIPDELCQMTKLDYFTIRNNQIKELPRGLIYLTNLIPSGEETDETRRLFVEGLIFHYACNIAYKLIFLNDSTETRWNRIPLELKNKKANLLLCFFIKM